jgi:hypothetical protein
MNNNLGIKVKLKNKFSVIKETLERIGIRAEQKKKFYPSCYLVEDEDAYRIYHFKELFIKDGNESTFNDKDEYRRNTICFLMKNWDLIEIDEDTEDMGILVEKLDILPYKDKGRYRICHKYLFKRDVKI